MLFRTGVISLFLFLGAEAQAAPITSNECATAYAFIDDDSDAVSVFTLGRDNEIWAHHWNFYADAATSIKLPLSIRWGQNFAQKNYLDQNVFLKDGLKNFTLLNSNSIVHMQMSDTKGWTLKNGSKLSLGYREYWEDNLKKFQISRGVIQERERFKLVRSSKTQIERIQPKETHISPWARVLEQPVARVSEGGMSPFVRNVDLRTGSAWETVASFDISRGEFLSPAILLHDAKAAELLVHTNIFPENNFSRGIYAYNVEKKNFILLSDVEHDVEKVVYFEDYSGIVGYYYGKREFKFLTDSKLLTVLSNYIDKIDNRGNYKFRINNQSSERAIIRSHINGRMGLFILFDSGELLELCHS